MAWQDAALCRDDPDPNAWYAHRLEAERRAYALEACARCPVSRECLSFALDRDDRHGIWGGILPEDRDPAEDTRQAVLEVLDLLGGRATVKDLVGATGLPAAEVTERIGALAGTRTILWIAPRTYALADDDVVSGGRSSVGGVA